MKTMVRVVLVVGIVGLLAGITAQGFAQEAEALNQLLPAKVTGDGIEAWFFSFLERLLGLFADFIGRILGDIFGGIGGLFGGEPNVRV